MHNFENLGDIPEVIQEMIHVIKMETDFSAMPVLAGIMDIQLGAEDDNLSETFCRWLILLPSSGSDPVLFPFLIHGEPDARFQGNLRDI